MPLRLSKNSIALENDYQKPFAKIFEKSFDLKFRMRLETIIFPNQTYNPVIIAYI